MLLLINHFYVSHFSSKTPFYGHNPSRMCCWVCWKTSICIFRHFSWHFWRIIGRKTSANWFESLFLQLIRLKRARMTFSGKLRSTMSAMNKVFYQQALFQLISGFRVIMPLVFQLISAFRVQRVKTIICWSVKMKQSHNIPL